VFEEARENQLDNKGKLLNILTSFISKDLIPWNILILPTQSWRS